VASPLASASSWSAAETSRGFLLVLRVGFVLNSHRIDPPSKIENSFAQYFFFFGSGEVLLNLLEPAVMLPSIISELSAKVMAK
jgi:hypothetical protein